MRVFMVIALLLGMAVMCYAEDSTATFSKKYSLEPLKRQIDWDKERLVELKAKTNADLFAEAKLKNDVAIEGLQETVDRRKQMLADMKIGGAPTEEYFSIGGYEVK